HLQGGKPASAAYCIKCSVLSTMSVAKRMTARLCRSGSGTWEHLRPRHSWCDGRASHIGHPAKRVQCRPCIAHDYTRGLEAVQPIYRASDTVAKPIMALLPGIEQSFCFALNARYIR